MDASSVSLPDKVQMVLDEVLKEHGFKNAEISVTQFTLKGENYMGVIYSAKAAVSGKKIELILKVAPLAEAMRKHVPINNIYKREIFVYENLLTEFEKLQANVDIPAEKRLYFPKCYKTSNEYLHETLVLEDLKASGFKIFNRFNKYDFEHTRLTLEAIGKYHALSFALQKNDPKKHAYFAEKLKETLYLSDVDPEFKANSNIFFAASIAKAVENLDSEELKDKLKKFGEDVYDRIAENLRPKGICVLGHGDCWSNNMMYKYKDGKPVDIRLLDFQLSRYGSPVLDIMYFIFCCTDQDLRKDHYDDMLKTYHNALRDHLAHFSLDVEKCYPWSTLLEDLKTNTTFPLCIAINNILAFSTDAESAPALEDLGPDADWSNLPIFRQRPSGLYVHKINGLVADFHRFDYF